MEVLHARCAGLDVHRDTVVACCRVMIDNDVNQDVQTFGTTTKDLLALSEWLTAHAVTHVAMEATGVYWKPIWHVLDGHFDLILANASHVKNVPVARPTSSPPTLSRSSTRPPDDRCPRSIASRPPASAPPRARSARPTSETSSRA